MKRPFRFVLRIVTVALLAVAAVTAYSLVAVRGTFQRPLPESQARGTGFTVGKSGHRIVGRVFLTGEANPHAPLVVVLHGDAPFRNPGYQYEFAERLAQAVPGTRVAALLRPGYTDPFGAKSDGDRGFAIGENYTPDVIAALAEAIRELKSEWRVSRVLLVGHSGGAASAASVAALDPGLIDRLYLVGCPCDVPAFRKHMASAQHDPMWLLPSHSLSPMDALDQMQQRTAITAISGSDDPIALPEYARAYIAKANARGISATMVTLPGEGHEILLDPRVIDIIAKAAAPASQ